MNAADGRREAASTRRSATPLSSYHAYSLPSTCFDQWDLSRNGAGYFQAESLTATAGTWFLVSPPHRETREGSSKMADSLYRSQSYKIQ